MTDVLLFLDALAPRELGSGFLENLSQGTLDAGAPRVTPRVMSSIYTGEPPEHNGLLSVSKYGGPSRTRPERSTFIEQAIREGNDVLCVGMPFCIPFQSNQDGSVLHGTTMGGQSQTIPPNTANFINVPAPAADMIRDDPESTFRSFHDQVGAQFAAFRESLRRWEFDIGILGIRLIDSYCHFQHTETRGGRPYRQHLIEYIDNLVHETYQQIDGDVMYFSDHGQQELETVFRANLWLAENGYLDYKVDLDFIGQLEEYTGGEDHPVAERVENQVSIRQAGVVIDEKTSQVVCDDPFDSCLTLVCDRDEFDADQFRDDLMATGLYRSVDYKWEIYDRDADFYEDMPDIIPDRDAGVFVSGNFHPEPIGMGWYRTGVHDWTGSFGASQPLNAAESVSPEGLNGVINDFLGLSGDASPLDPAAVRQFQDDELVSAYNDLQERMYEQGIEQ